MTYLAKPKRGFLLGKFMPPHQGHVYLCDFARSYVETLTILLCSLPDDPIPGEVRFEWMRELFPGCRVVWCSDVVPQKPKDDPDRFWEIWRGIVARHHPEPVDAVFASEEYGHRLAAELGARFVPCDLTRSARDCSGTRIRTNPFDHWDFIPAPVRPYFVRRVCLFGPESSGKSTLANQLGQHYRTIVVPEYGRTFTDAFGADVNAAGIRDIVRGHLASVLAAKPQANRLVIEDTDPLLTAVWSDMLLGSRDPWFDSFDDYADLYLLCDVDFPWTDDGTRYFPDQGDRCRFFDLCEAELQRRAVHYIRVSGSPEERLTKAIAAIERLIAA